MVASQWPHRYRSSQLWAMRSNVGFHVRSKSKTNYQHALKTQARIGSGVVLAECILRPLATASKSTQTDPILDHECKESLT
jgi:hypothetical protein